MAHDTTLYMKSIFCYIFTFFIVYFSSGSKNSYEIFKYTRSAIDPKIELTRYDMPRAGLRLFARHASQFNQYLIEDYEVSNPTLSIVTFHKMNWKQIYRFNTYLARTESIKLCLQYRASSECSNVQVDQALYCWLINWSPHLDIL